MSEILLRLSKQWIAGQTADDAIRMAKLANARNIRGIINKLGEHIELEKEVQATVKEYLNILRRIERDKIQSCISVKLTQLGLSINDSFCYANVEHIVQEAEALGNFVWIDMESSQYTQTTIDLYFSLLNKHKNVGVAIQAYLRRSEDDIRNLILKNGKIRLCKGAYRESAKIAFKTKQEISSNFAKLLKLLFMEGKEFAIATHDNDLINEALELNRIYPKDFEFQMLMGIRDDLNRS
ncbi:MAG: proline dehydrogenase family protein [Euryarchaeota archaeon]|nr:proline dehydrogenase family protein [Euryarchaeota archaeon]